MTWLATILVLATTFLAVFWEAAFQGFRWATGVQLDLLPPLMVYAGLCTSLSTVILVAVCGGLWLDSLSANPLGISVLPLFVIGLVIFIFRELVLRDQTFAQLVLGTAASAAAPLMTLLLLFTLGYKPLVGWGTLWQLIVLSVGGALATPACFVLFGWLQHHLFYVQTAETTFRPDREIRRGR